MFSTSEMLAEVPLFALLDVRERKILAARVNIVHFKTGDVIFSYGDPGDSL